MRIIPSKCKVCHVDLRLEIDDECPDSWLKKLLPLAVCDRCGDFMRSRNRLTDMVDHACGDLIQAKMNPKTKPERIEEIRKNLNSLTHRYADLVCRYYRTPIYWEPEFVEQLMEQPSKHELILRTYRGLVHKTVKQPKK